MNITKHLVELHGGTITAASDGVGRGATFVVRLPMNLTGLERPHAWKAPTAAPPRASAGFRELTHFRVLVVDDNADARELVAAILETSGADVHAASSVAEALARLDDIRPDVIISDIGMREEDGYALIRSVRMSPSEQIKKMPALALSAFASNEERTRALVSGFNAYMTKPVHPSALQEMVLDLVGVSSSARARKRDEQNDESS
jgi:CheY-like chemotaxis protein